MSRSYRKPFIYWCKGIRESHQQDKTLASRCFRRMANSQLRSCEDWDEFLYPHRYEASHNDRWGWVGDGDARLFSEPSQYLLTHLGIGDSWRSLKEALDEAKKYSRK